MHNLKAASGVLVVGLMASASMASAQSVAPVSVESAVSINHFVGQNAQERPDIVVDFTATVRVGKGWVAYARPWFRKASSDPYATAKEIYQAAIQYERSGPVSTRVDFGYILSPIGLGMMDMRNDTNPTITPHLSYLIPMPSFDAGVPSSLPIASSYPPGAQVTASTRMWDARAAVVMAPPNRMFVLGAASPNPSSHPTLVVGGGLTPRAGLRIGLAYAGGEYATAGEMTRPISVDTGYVDDNDAPAGGLTAMPVSSGRHLNMVSLEGEFAFGYTRLTGEVTRDSLQTGTGHTVATEWFVQGIQSLTPRWFVAGRHEGVNAPPQFSGREAPTLRVSEVTVGYRVSREFTVRTALSSRKTYFSPLTNQQVGASLVWTRRWW